MEIKERLKEWFHSIESDPQEKLHLLAFRDFCVDLFEEEYGRMPPEEEIGPPFGKLPAHRRSFPEKKSHLYYAP